MNESDLVRQQYGDSSRLDARIALHTLFSVAHRPFHAWYWDHFELPPDARVLELGCGSAALWAVNRSRVPAAWRPVLTDFSSGMVETTRGKFAAWGLGGAFAVADAQAIPFPEGRFDAVVANHMLYHVPDLPRALAEIRRVLVPGGALYAATNGIHYMQELDELTAEAGTASVWSRVAPHFTMENGADILAAHVGPVRRHDFEDALLVTEVEPLIAYIESGFTGMGGGPDAEALDRIRQVIAARIAHDGGFRITKEMGMFVATKAAWSR